LTATCLALVVQLPGMNMAVFLEVLGSALWTRLFHDHERLLASPAMGEWFRPTIPWNHDPSITCITLPHLPVFPGMAVLELAVS
jgi:hypothetical protein